MMSVTSKVQCHARRCFYSGLDRPKRLSLKSLKSKVSSKQPICAVTAYDYISAMAAEQANVDVILIGDSVCNVVLGRSKTSSATMDEMIHHTKAVADSTYKPLIMGDLPLGSYSNEKEASRNALRFLNAGCGIAKVEGHHVNEIRAVGKILPVCGHLGLLPQTSTEFRGYGKTFTEAQQLIHQALDLQEAGIQMCVLEKVSNEVSEAISQLISCPVIGIGSGPLVDGQVLVWHDITGLHPPGSIIPSFSKCYFDEGLSRMLSSEELYKEMRPEFLAMNDKKRLKDNPKGYSLLTNIISSYRESVINKTFPSKEHTVYMDEKEKEKLTAYVESLKTKSATDISISSLSSSISPPKYKSVKQPAFIPPPSEKKPRVLVIGGGSIGGLLSYFLSPQSDVQVLTNWKEQKEAIVAQGGLSFFCPNEKKFLPVRSVSLLDESVEVEPFDIIFSCVKSSKADYAAEIAKKYKRKGSVIISMQNGLLGSEVLAKKFSTDPSVSLLQILTSEGVQSNPGGSISGGRGTMQVASIAAHGHNESAISWVDQLLKDSGFSIQPRETKNSGKNDFDLAQWKKLAVSTAVNPLTGLLNIPNGELMRSNDAATLAELICEETARVARAKGIPLSDDAAKAALWQTVRHSSENTSSMLQDIKKRRLPEIDALNESVALHGRRNSVSTPFNSLISLLIRTQHHLQSARSTSNNLQDNSGSMSTHLRPAFEVIQTRNRLCDLRRDKFQEGKKITFIPFLGGLHEGHLQLVKEAQKRDPSNEIWTSLFLNPTQFQSQSDFDTYPMILEKDIALLKAHGVSVVFTPTIQEVYGSVKEMKWINPKISCFDNIGAGEHTMREGFFDGIANVLLRFFSWFQPEKAVFGEKDFQQVCLVRRILNQFFPLTELVTVPTVRENDGLPYSSRNARLTAEERERGWLVYETLRAMHEGFLSSGREMTVDELVRIGMDFASKNALQVDYISVSDAYTGLPAHDSVLRPGNCDVVIHIACKLHQGSAVRIVDNIYLNRQLPFVPVPPAQKTHAPSNAL